MKAFLAALVAIALLGGCSDPDRPSIPLYLAMQRGDIDQLERHLFWGSDINTLLPDGQFPLHIAAEKGRVIMVRALLKHDARIDGPNSSGDTALDLAILNGRTQVAELLLERGAALDASALLIKAATKGVTDRDTVRFLVERGADTERVDAAGDTPLLIAIRQDNHRLVAHLVNHGADVNARTANGRSALQLAKDLQLPELVTRLQRLGAS